MLTYPQNFVSRFAPMADGRMAVATVHVPPYLSLMNEPGRIPEASAVLGGSDPRAASDLKAMSLALMTQATVSAFLQDDLAVVSSEGQGLQWTRGNGSLFWTSTRVGHCLVSAKDLESKTYVTLDRSDPRWNVEIGRSTAAGRCVQENTIDSQDRVSTERFEFEAFYGKDRGARLPYFSGWHLMAGGAACFDASAFLVDLMELALIAAADQGPLAVSFEMAGGDEKDVGLWEIPTADQTITLAGFSAIEQSLTQAFREVCEDPWTKLYFNLHRRGDPERGGSRYALPLSVDGVISQEALLLTFYNASNRGLMRLPAALEPALTAFFPKIGQ